MSVHRFMKCPDMTMKKSFIIEGDDCYIYRISVLQTEWSPSVRVMCHNWIKDFMKGDIKPFRWGTFEKIKRDDYVSADKPVCIDCKRTFKSRSGLMKHKHYCKHKKTQLVTQEPVNEIIRERRTFGNENPKWLTSDLLYGVLNNIQQAIPVMMRRKHFNDKFPENKNLQIDSKRNIDERMQVFEEGRWTIKGSRQTFYKVLVSMCDILSDALEEDETSGFHDAMVENPQSEEDSDSDNEDTHIGREIRRLRNCDKFIRKINKIRPLWNSFREKISNPEQRTDLWEDLKTLLLDKQLAIEQGFS
jgi:hypothetical protein